MRVMVLGASGDQGVPLVTALQAHGHEVIAGVRRDDALANTPFPGLPRRIADIDRSETLLKAFDEIDALAFHLPFEFDRERARGWGRAIAAAAKQAGVGRIVFNTACVVADHDIGVGGHDGRREIEAGLLASGAHCTFIEPTVFMDNMIRPWAKPSILRGVFAYPCAPELKISWVCLRDVAQAVAAAVSLRDLPQHLPLGGPEALTGDEVAERLSPATKREVRFVSLDPQDFAAKMSELVTGSREVEPHSLYDGMARFYRWYNEQPVSPLAVDPAGARETLGISLTPLGDWAARQDWSG